MPWQWPRCIHGALPMHRHALCVVRLARRVRFSFYSDCFPGLFQFHVSQILNKLLILIRVEISTAGICSMRRRRTRGERAMIARLLFISVVLIFFHNQQSWWCSNKFVHPQQKRPWVFPALPERPARSVLRATTRGQRSDGSWIRWLC